MRIGDVGRGGLPSPPTPLIGREGDLEAVQPLVERHRLVTLTGAGGSGKTRLAIEVAQRRAEQHSDGATFVAIQDARDDEGVVSAIADAIGVAERGALDVGASIQAYLGDRDELLILDNFEQVLSAAALVNALLAAAPLLRIIVTSRAPLRIDGEHEYEVLPLDIEAAISLFIERATAVRSTFDANEHEASVHRLVERVDGLPLAVELAAAQVRHLTPEMIIERFDRALPVLEGGKRDAPARQRTQRATLDWSHDLLGRSARRLFAALSVFSGGWTLDAALRVCAEIGGSSIDVVAGLSELVAASLVRVTEDGERGMRYTMLQVTREYAAERLAASADHRVVERRHAEWMRDLVEEAEPHLVLADLRAWQERLRAEEENLRSALRWAIVSEETETGLRIAGACWRYWYYWAASREGIAWLEAVLGLPRAEAAGEPRARALSSLAALWWNQGRGTESLDAYLEVIDILRELGIEDERLSDAFDDAAWAAQLEGDSAEAVRLTEEKWRHPIRRRSTYFHGWIDRDEDVALRSFYPQKPDAFLLSAVERARVEALLTDQALFAANATATAGQLQHMAGNFDVGLHHARESLRLYRDLGHRGQVSISLTGLAARELILGRPERAARLAAAAGREADELGGTVNDQSRFLLLGRPDADAASQLPANVHARVTREGRAMSRDEAIAYALGEPEPSPHRRERRGRYDLTPRECEVLALVADGRTDGEIAAALIISKKTVSVHVSSIKGKLGANSRAEIVSMAIRGGLVGQSD